ncbi:hypothetical protein [Parasphingorhabdus sp.]
MSTINHDCTGVMHSGELSLGSEHNKFRFSSSVKVQ